MANRNQPIQDLREWIDDVEELGELVRVTKPVDRDEEMGAIAYLLGKQNPSPTVLFENPNGFDDNNPIGASLLWNLVGPSIKRIAITLEEPADTPTIELITRVKGKMAILPLTRVINSMVGVSAGSSRVIAMRLMLGPTKFHKRLAPIGLLSSNPFGFSNRTVGEGFCLPSR